MKQYQSFMAWLLLCMHLLLFHFPSFSFSSSFNFLCHHDESSALLQFKSSFTIIIDTIPYCDNGESHHLKTATWKNGSDCCSWNGVTCDTISGHVIGLNLGCEGIEGTLHPNSTLFHLTHLQSLNLSYIHFYPSPFHFKFGGFLSLTYLDLSHCYFKGEVPIQISHLSKLESLHLSSNYDLVLKETTLKRLVQNATNLRDLFLGGTNMSSIRPNSMELIFNQSSSLVTLNLLHTFLSGKLKRSLFCLPNIQQLHMSDNFNLEGQLPELSCSTSLRILDLSRCPFNGPIPQSFSNLTHLTSLHISSNNLNGSIPSSLLTLLHLTSLDLSYNDLSGQIPDVFGRMTELQYLNLAYNNLEGQIPSSLFNLSQLIELDFYNNKLEGPLPNKITGFQNLTNLRLNDNLLNGTIPLWCLSLPSLKTAYLSNNRLTTWHVDDAFSSNSLEVLSLNNNMLQGEIPKSIFSLASLRFLFLHSNNLSGLFNIQIFSKLQNLVSLSLSQNSQLSLNFESNVSYSFNQLYSLELSSVNLIKFHKLQGNFTNLNFLDLSNNKLNGMPKCLIETGHLQYFNLSQNLFTSTDQLIEMAVNNNEYLSVIDLSFNSLNGDIPLAVCNINSHLLEFLNLGHNNLSGIIPQCFSNFQSLQFLDLQMNKFHGTLPSNFSKYITILNLNGNLLEGLLPKSLSHCKYLNILNLGSNRLEDKFPDWLQTLQDLKVLVLRDNRFHGPIANLKMKYLFPSLVIFDISDNNFSGFLPKAYFKNYEAMKNVTQVGGDSSLIYMEFSCRAFSIGRCTDSVTVTTKGNKLTLGRIPKLFASIDLSRNKFEGEIPNSIGELHALKGLNLSHNRLVGHIPQSIGNLTYLESLDLSSNMLTGVIPAELTNMNSIEVLNLSNNNLTGEIPHGRQFNTFTNDSYEGNLGLCGFPLTKKCGPEPEQHQSPPSADNIWSEEKFGFGWKPVAIGYGCGFVIGIGLGYLVFLIGKPRWLVMIFGGQPKRRVNRRRIRVRRTNGSTQMVPMS